MGGINERHKEIKRRRKRKVAVAKITRRATKATSSEKEVLVRKLRNLTPGASVIIDRLNLLKK
jgi:hypothetical protein